MGTSGEPPSQIDDAAAEPIATPAEAPPPSIAAGTWPHILSKKAITIDDPDSFNRWLMPLAGAFVHVSIGSVYAWSMVHRAALLTSQLCVPSSH